MIKVRSIGEQLFKFSKTGVTAVAETVNSFVIPFNGRIRAIYAVYGLMGTDGTGAPTQNIKVDIEKNGTSIFSGATLIEWSHALQVGTANTSIAADTYGALTTNPPSVVKGDRVTINVDQILNGTNPTQPSDLEVYIVLARANQSPIAKMLTGQVSSED